MTDAMPDTDTRLLSPLYIWPGGWLALMSAMDNQPHQHVAASLLVGLEGPLRVCVDDQRLQQPAVRVAPESRQSLHTAGPVAVLHLDPDETAWRALRNAPDPLPLAAWRRSLLGLAGDTVQIDQATTFIQSLRQLADTPPLDPRIVQACEQLRADNSTDLESLAAAANLSASRFRRLFSEQLGVSFKRFVLHLKCQRALSLWRSGMSLTELAVAAGFYDQPHLNRTLRAMFDALPSRYARGQSVQVVPLSLPANTRTTPME